jgi:hypothetical protein
MCVVFMGYFVYSFGKQNESKIGLKIIDIAVKIVTYIGDFRLADESLEGRGKISLV